MKVQKPQGRSSKLWNPLTTRVSKIVRSQSFYCQTVQVSWDNRDVVAINLSAVSVVSYLCRLQHGVAVVWGILIVYNGSMTAPYPLFPDNRLKFLTPICKLPNFFQHCICYKLTQINCTTETIASIDLIYLIPSNFLF